MLRRIAPEGEVVLDYDRSHLLTYAELLEADASGVNWNEGAREILGIDPKIDGESAQRCWETHLARARWITGAGLDMALSAFGRCSA